MQPVGLFELCVASILGHQSPLKPVSRNAVGKERERKRRGCRAPIREAGT